MTDTTAQPTRPYSLAFDIYPDYLYARVTSEKLTIESSLRYLHEIVDKCRELGCHRLMIEKDVPMMLDMAQAFTVASDFSDMRANSIKVAHLDKRTENFERNKFFILVSNNHGGSSRIFTEYAAAEEWLLESAL